jgi:acyl carrier protein
MDEDARLLIAEHLGVSRALIVDTASFRSLGADSLDLISLTMAFEERFDFHISDEQAEACTTVRDALALLDQGVIVGSGDRRSAAGELIDARG